MLTSVLLFLVFGVSAQVTQRVTSEGLILHYQNEGDHFELAGDHFIPVTQGATRLYKKGAPDLEKRAISIPVKDVEGELTIEIRNAKYVKRQVYIPPSIGLVTQEGLTNERIEGDFYQTDVYPVQSFSSQGRYQIGTVSYENIWLHLQQYQPHTQSLKILTECEILVRGDFLKQLSKEENETEQFLTVIAPDSLHATLAPFLEWKSQLGFTTDLASSNELDTQSKIKAYLKSQYDEEQLDYAIMVGLKSQTPFDQSSFGLGDYAYGRLSGNDQYAEVAVGRFPAETKEKLTLLVEKTIRYEQGGVGKSWFTTMASAASDEGGSIGDKGETDFEHLSGINDVFGQNGFSANIVHQGASENPDIGELLNKGCGYFFYAGHGVESAWQSTRFNMDSVRALKNETHPVMINAACLNANFNKVPNLAYEFMTASYDGKPAGFTAMLSSSITQLWAPPMLGQDVFAEQLLKGDGNQKTLGDLVLEAEYDVMNNYGYGGIETVYTWVLCGDPSLRMWTQTPQSITATIPEVFDITSDEFTVQGPEDATVTIVHQGQLLDKQCIQNGQAILNRGGVIISDSVTVTITLVDHLPLVRKLAPYNNGAAFYNIASLQTTQRNDQRIENGVWSDVEIEIWNLGEIDGENIQVHVSSPDGKVTFSDSLFELSRIAGEELLMLDSLNIQTSEDYPDQEEFRIIVTVQDDLGQVNINSFVLEVAAPELSTPVLMLNGTSFSTEYPVNFLDTATVSVIIQNNGNASSESVSVDFLISDVFVDVISEVHGDLMVPANSSDTLSFLVTFDTQTPGGYLFDGTLLLSSTDSNHFGFYHLSKPELVIGNEDFAVAEYPFYNYYKSSRSQFIYLKEELGLDSKIIDSLALNIQQYPFLSNQTGLKDFTIRMIHTDMDTIDAQFTDLNVSTVVFHEELLQLHQALGWFYFDIEDFYYSGENNVMLEFSWGQNSYTTNYSSSYRIYAHQTTHELGIYGYTDANETVPVVGRTKNRPDLKVSEIPSDLFAVKIFYQDVGKEFSADSLGVQIGGKYFQLNLNDFQEMVLPPGEYSYQMKTLPEHEVFLDSTFTVSESDQWINLSGSEPISGLLDLNEASIELSVSKGVLSIHSSGASSIQVINLQGQVIAENESRKLHHDIAINENQGIVFVRLFFEDHMEVRPVVIR